MNLLIVEDDSAFIADLSSAIEELRPPVKVMRCGSRDEALDLIGTLMFDLIVCDLVVPSAAGALDAAIENGLAVIDAIPETQPGTPVVVLSAFATLDVAQDLMGRATSADVFGERSGFATFSFVQKKRLTDCFDMIKHVANQVKALKDVAVEATGSDSFSYKEKRILSIFARRLDGALVKAKRLTGGLSTSSVIRLRVLDERSDVVSDAVAKISTCGDVHDEKERYSRAVAPSLKVGDFATEIDHVLYGGGNLAGVFYSVAPGDRSLLEVIKSDLGLACTTVRKLKELEKPWLQGAPTEGVGISSVRAWFAGDEISQTMDAELQADWRSFESRRLMIVSARQHGDLHPGNIMVREDGAPVLIDFGRVGRYSAAVDPVSLEMALLFHPDARSLLADWNPASTASRWCNVQAFVSGCPVADFIVECRNWAASVGASRREWISVGYAVAARQLRFRDTDHRLAVAIAKAAIEAYDA